MSGTTSKASTKTNPTSKNVSQVIWNRAVKAARTAMATAGKANWVIGDQAACVATAYGENRIGAFADAIGAEVATVRNMRTVSLAYPESEIKRDLQSWTVYAAFASQYDRFALVTDGNDDKPWTASAARALIKTRNGNGSESDGNGEGESDGNGSEPAGKLSEIDQARANVARLQAELATALVRLATLEAAEASKLPMLDNDGTDPILASAKAKLNAVKPAPAKTAPAKTAPAKTAPAKTAPAKTAPAKTVLSEGNAAKLASAKEAIAKAKLTSATPRVSRTRTPAANAA